jgi:three-Cys-motif partner protein
MATGTAAGLLVGPQPQSVFKHQILDQHVIRYAAMTASRLTPKRAVIVDGFAGRGRYENGSAASAETLMLHAQKLKNATQIDIFLVEKSRKDYKVLDEVADQYRANGIRIETRNGDCGDYLDEAVARAQGASLFLFLDPCGANLPFEVVERVLRLRSAWPRTEVLLNFSADLIRRAGGQYKKGQLDLGGVAAADIVCGGEWWRDVALNMHLASGGKDWESAAEAVALEYARRLSGGRMSSVVAPVRRQPHHQPVYHLIFLTADSHGLWVFGNAAAVAREKWLQALGPDEDAESGMLFSIDTVGDQLADEKKRALRIIPENIRALVADGKVHAVVKDVTKIFGDVYGEARETTFSAALRQLVKDGEVVYVEKGAKPHKHLIRKA